MLALPVGLIPRRGRPSESGVGRRTRPGKRLAGPRHDYDLGVRVAANIPEGLGELAVGRFAPLEGTAIGMEGDLQDAVAALHADGMVFLGIALQRRHGSCSSAR